MVKKPKWSLQLSDDEFVELSREYFDSQIWDLHTALCLWQKLDPSKKEPPVGQYVLNYGIPNPDKDDRTDRGFKVAYEAITCPDQETAERYGIIRLPAIKCPLEPQSAKNILVNPRRFLSWLEQRFAGQQSYMQAAESAYQKRKAVRKTKKARWTNPKENSKAHKQYAREAFDDLVKEQNIDLEKARIVSQLARKLHERLKESIENPYAEKTLQSQTMIPAWIREYLSEQ